MFEDSLVESRVGRVSSSKRWTMLVSIGLQGVIVGVVMMLPLLHLETLPFRVEAPKVVVPLMPKPPVPVVQVQKAAAASSSNMAAPSMTRPLIFSSLLPSSDAITNDAPPLAPFGNTVGMPGGLPNALGTSDGHGPAVTVAGVKVPAGPLRISSLSEGMLLAPIRPVYPAIAKAAHVEGSVVVEAVISRQGTIESLRAVSGPQMLQNAALEAIRAARYLPYRLNGEPTEVQTTITVNFRMNG